ncbi:MAG: efflux RND transporter periplasmic adaptor subunit [Pseudomonadota bacterium]
MTDETSDRVGSAAGGNAFLIVSALVVVALFVGVAVKFAAAPTKSANFSPPPTPVTAMIVRGETFVDAVEAVGALRANESLTITATLTETVRTVSFESGMEVIAGDILAELTDEEEAADLTDARARLEEAARQYRRSSDLVRRGVAADSTLDAAISARDQAQAQVRAIEARIADYLVRAPFSGVVGLRLVSPGALVQPGDEIATLDDISSVKLDFPVPEVFLANVRRGMTVNATAAAYPSEVFSGTVESIDTRIDPVTRSILVRSVLTNDDRRLRPGMLMTVELVREERVSPAVPELSVILEGDRAFVFVIEEQPRAVAVENGGEGRAGGAQSAPVVEMRSVRLGLRQDGLLEVLSGLDIGERIVAQGVASLRDGAPVRIAPSEDPKPTAARLGSS